MTCVDCDNKPREDEDYCDDCADAGIAAGKLEHCPECERVYRIYDVDRWDTPSEACKPCVSDAAEMAQFERDHSVVVMNGPLPRLR